MVSRIPGYTTKIRPVSHLFRNGAVPLSEPVYIALTDSKPMLASLPALVKGRPPPIVPGAELSGEGNPALALDMLDLPRFFFLAWSQLPA